MCLQNVLNESVSVAIADWPMLHICTCRTEQSLTTAACLQTLNNQVAREKPACVSFATLFPVKTRIVTDRDDVLTQVVIAQGAGENEEHSLYVPKKSVGLYVPVM